MIKMILILVMMVIAFPVNAAIYPDSAVVPFEKVSIAANSKLTIYYYNQRNWDALLCLFNQNQALFNAHWMFRNQQKKYTNLSGALQLCLDGSFNCGPNGNGANADHDGTITIKNVSGNTLSVSCNYACLGAPNDCP